MKPRMSVLTSTGSVCTTILAFLRGVFPRLEKIKFTQVQKIFNYHSSGMKYLLKATTQTKIDNLCSYDELVLTVASYLLHIILVFKSCSIHLFPSWSFKLLLWLLTNEK